MSTSIRTRAKERLKLDKEGNGGGTSETIGPISVTARSLWGEAPFSWASTLYSAREIAIPMDPNLRSSIFLTKGAGQLIISISGMETWAFYVECSIVLSDPAMSVRWGADLSDVGPVEGVATLDPATGMYFFATPRADRADVQIIIDSKIGSAPDLELLNIQKVDIIGLR